MTKTYFFYDLETSGLNARSDRIMQFAGIRTDLDFNQIGDPYNILVKVSDDTLPSPGALMVTGISPQSTVDEGYSEAEFAKILSEEIFTEDTIILGYNSIRFDDEFIRSLLWRNYYDPYEWSYKDGRSRWDLLDVVRITRALRPEGINWPAIDGKPTNKLELLSKKNGLEHTHAHDALSDVEALIGVAKLIRSKQPNLYDYLLKMRDKNEVKKIVNLERPQPFVYSSGRYESEYNKTTVAFPIAPAEYGHVYVYDLRYSPSEWIGKSKADIKAIIDTPYNERGEDYQKLPVKKLQYNRCPAVAPVGVLEQSDGWEKIGLDLETIESHKSILLENPQFSKICQEVLSDRPEFEQYSDAEAKIYDGFVGDKDKLKCEVVRNMTEANLSQYKPDFIDKRLSEMFVRYKARNFPNTLNDEERSQYEEWRVSHLEAQSHKFAKDLEYAAAKADLTDSQQYILEELKLWYENIMPDSY